MFLIKLKGKNYDCCWPKTIDPNVRHSSKTASIWKDTNTEHVLTCSMVFLLSRASHELWILLTSSDVNLSSLPEWALEMVIRLLLRNGDLQCSNYQRNNWMIKSMNISLRTVPVYIVDGKFGWSAGRTATYQWAGSSPIRVDRATLVHGPLLPQVLSWWTQWTNSVWVLTQVAAVHLINCFLHSANGFSHVSGRNKAIWF